MRSFIEKNESNYDSRYSTISLKNKGSFNFSPSSLIF